MITAGQEAAVLLGSFDRGELGSFLVVRSDVWIPSKQSNLD